MFEIFKDDFYRNTGEKFKLTPKNILRFMAMHNIRYICCLRILTDKRLKIIHPIVKLYRFSLSRKYGIEILPGTKIGQGFRMGHPYNITVAPTTIIGNNVNINKGATIGISCVKNRGVGAPVIGDKVQIGINSTVVGKIKIGDDVVIAPNTFVNEDVPSHSIVIGNPCKIIH